MTDIRQEANTAIDALVRLHKLERLAQRRREANAIDRRECGNCTRWMCSGICPRERREKGRRVGPSMGTPACAEFELLPHVAEMKIARLTEIQADLAALG